VGDRILWNRAPSNFILGHLLSLASIHTLWQKEILSMIVAYACLDLPSREPSTRPEFRLPLVSFTIVSFNK
jgi:hypothetical protein